MSPGLERLSITPSSFPRVSGDEPRATINGKSLEAFSPRERG